MTPAEFEEKEYEFPVNHELLGRSTRLWTPGQVFEGQFGIDAALMSRHHVFWQYMGHGVAPEGVVLRDYPWGELGFPDSSNTRFPNFSVNMLIQYKRPDFLIGKNSRLASRGIRGSYWRFHILPHQQRILELIAAELGSHAVVTYACAAFHTHDALFQNTENRTLVQQSTVVSVGRLAAHNTWAYSEPGSCGVGCSEPEIIVDVPFEERFRSAAAVAQELRQFAASRYLQALAFAAQRAASVGSEEGNPIAREYLKRVPPDESTYIRRSVDPTRDFLAFSALLHLTGTSWLVVGPE